MKKEDVRKIIREEINKVLNENFKDFVNKVVDNEIEIATTGEFPDLQRRLKRLETLRKISDPKKFKSMYKSITGATDWDLPDELRDYLP